MKSTCLSQAVSRICSGSADRPNVRQCQREKYFCRRNSARVSAFVAGEAEAADLDGGSGTEVEGGGGGSCGAGAGLKRERRECDLRTAQILVEA